ncbi:hypothetical protein HYS28_02420 [Candidatus Uhrbacteria bacterium]|nr:hypothetical protein [Candidatus Uhrbacteria bacterium]
MSGLERFRCIHGLPARPLTPEEEEAIGRALDASLKEEGLSLAEMMRQRPEEFAEEIANMPPVLYEAIFGEPKPS